MSKMLKIESCLMCFNCLDIEGEDWCKKLDANVNDPSKILQNCPLEDYPDKDKECPKFRCERGRDEHGALFCPCPHCGDEVLF